VPGAPEQPWGFYRLGSQAARRLVAAADVGRGDLVVDVGAGEGAITTHLVATGARVVAIELHPRRVAFLRQRFAGAPVTVARADARDLRLPGRPFHVVANVPFAATSPLLARLLAPGSRMLSAHLVLQRQAARRWTGPAAPARARWERSFDLEILHAVPRHAFEPRPRVGAAVVRIRRRS
jgi:23S rRNA (adenine-N6)-dimethyltransferase